MEIYKLEVSILSKFIILDFHKIGEILLHLCIWLFSLEKCICVVLFQSYSTFIHVIFWQSDNIRRSTNIPDLNLVNLT